MSTFAFLTLIFVLSIPSPASGNIGKDPCISESSAMPVGFENLLPALERMVDHDLDGDELNEISPEPEPDISVFKSKAEALLARMKSGFSPEDDAFPGEIEKLKELYLKIDRSRITSEEAYDNEYLLRLLNSQILSQAKKLKRAKRITQSRFDRVLLTAQIATKGSAPEGLAPKKSLPYNGTYATSVELSDWQDDPDFYNYKFEGDFVVYRGMKLRAGDLILNHTTSKPAGLYTAFAEEPNIFSHSGALVFLSRNGKRLPVVLDMHERGIRAVPLSEFLGPKIVTYAEIFRLKKELIPSDFEAKLAQEASHLLGREIPYDLSGTQNEEALSCAELLGLLYKRVGIEPFRITKGISDRIYPNILKLGKIERDFITPAQIAQSSSLEAVGYVDNALPFSRAITNEAVLNVFRESMKNSSLKTGESSLATELERYAITQMRDPNSMVGDLLLSVVGFNRENFPFGSKQLLLAIYFMDGVASDAYESCTPEPESPESMDEEPHEEPDDDPDPAECSTVIRNVTNSAMRSNSFSMSETLRDQMLFDSVATEMPDWMKLFE